MKEMKVELTFIEDVLGTSPTDKEIYSTYIASKGPNAQTKEEEIEALGEDEVVEKAMTVFPRTDDGNPMFWDYQIKGFFKNSCSALRKVAKTESSKIKAYKKEIDGLIFVNERKIPIECSGEVGVCQRPLRASTAQGERIALAISESVPEGSKIVFTISMLHDGHLKAVQEWLDYGKLNGLGQWHNSGKGRFIWKSIEE